ncbi:unnamed protein product [Mytilus coruscus]|uniref:Uncharacterized protein n=1 Tax=Mytilus coruscus TaxID=42192 RepID=A0A6J8BDK8_MYTCO|nr:unnamed protein product [Mytilus coruscus]
MSSSIAMVQYTTKINDNVINKNTHICLSENINCIAHSLLDNDNVLVDFNDQNTQVKLNENVDQCENRRSCDIDKRSYFELCNDLNVTDHFTAVEIYNLSSEIIANFYSDFLNDDLNDSYLSVSNIDIDLNSSYSYDTSGRSPSVNSTFNSVKIEVESFETEPEKTESEIHVTDSEKLYIRTTSVQVLSYSRKMSLKDEIKEERKNSEVKSNINSNEAVVLENVQLQRKPHQTNIEILEDEAKEVQDGTHTEIVIPGSPPRLLKEKTKGSMEIDTCKNVIHPEIA